MAKSSVKAKLTYYLKEIANEPESVDDNGDVITKAKKLAMVVWDKALGGVTTDEKTGEQKQLKPEQWAISLIFDRAEGRIPNAPVAQAAGSPVSEKVSDLSRNAINAIQTTRTTTHKTIPPPPP